MQNAPLINVYTRLNAFIKTYTDKIPSYKDGFFEVPFAGNSPDAMVKSLGKLFMNKLDEKNQVIRSDTPFAEGDIHYFKLDEDCWLIAIDVMFKRNMRYKKMQMKEVTSNFYTFSYSKFMHKLPRTPKFNDNVLYSNDYFVITKPGTNIEACYMKGTHGLFINLMVTPQWFEKNHARQKIKSGSEVNDLMNSDRSYLSWPQLKGESIVFDKEIWNLVANKKMQDDQFNEKLKVLVYKMLNQFQESITNHDKELLYSDLNGDDRKQILLAERLLIKNVYDDFPGIDYIANEVSVSPTKLKICFKQIYGKTMFEYYQYHKMLASMTLLKTNKYMIKEVAQITGYESASKFTAAFKKEFGALPSDLSFK